MADTTLDNLTAATGTDLDDADLFLVLDGTNPPKKITRAELRKGIFGSATDGQVAVYSTASGWAAGVSGIGAALDTQTFTTAGADTWTKPASGSLARIQLWGGGGSGSTDNTGAGAGGGGGAYFEITLPLAALSASESLSVAAGGAAITASNADGNDGSASTFANWSAAGGQKGRSGINTTSDYGGGSGAGPNAAGNRWDVDPNEKQNPYDWGGGQGGYNATDSNWPSAGHAGWGWAGGGGGGGWEGAGTGGSGGGAEWAGGGGGGGADSGGTGGSGGSSTYGGNGGAGGANGNGTAGAQPGGGGGGADGATGDSGAGGDGKIIITVF